MRGGLGRSIPLPEHVRLDRAPSFVHVNRRGHQSRPTLSVVSEVLRNCALSEGLFPRPGAERARRCGSMPITLVLQDGATLPPRASGGAIEGIGRTRLLPRDNSTRPMLSLGFSCEGSRAEKASRHRASCDADTKLPHVMAGAFLDQRLQLEHADRVASDLPLPTQATAVACSS